MSILEIVLAAAGVVVSILSFLIPAKSEKVTEATKQLAREEIEKIVESEASTVKEKVDGVTEEIVQYAMEKAERSMERISNEKIMAVNEYSDTVLEEIHKNHQEVVFLYDMLNDKQKNIKKVIAETDQTIKKINENRKEKKEVPAEKADNFVALKPERQNSLGNQAKKLIKAEKNDDTAEMTSEKKARASTRKRTERLPEKINETEKNEISEPTGMAQSDDFDEAGANNNDRILSLHKSGKSIISIARELGLGMGEVRLVIDLYEGAGDRL